MRLGFVGTGTMGAPMAGCLIAAGHQLTVYDVRPDATAALCERGARPAEDPAAVARNSGSEHGVLAQIVPVGAGASRTFDNIPRSVLPGAFTAGGTLDIVAKDLQLARDLARDVGAPAHLGLLAHDVLSRAQAQGWGQEGFPIAARILEAMAGAELRAPAAEVATYQTQDPRRGRT